MGNYAANINYYMDAFALYEKGSLPYAGSIGDQPNKVIEIFNFIEHKRNEYQKKLEKEQAR